MPRAAHSLHEHHEAHARGRDHGRGRWLQEVRGDRAQGSGGGLRTRAGEVGAGPQRCRERIHDELDDIDRKLTDYRADIGRDGIVRYDEKRADAAKVKELVDRRVLLRTDLDALESSTDKDWETVKAKLDSDLGNRVFKRSRI